MAEKGENEGKSFNMVAKLKNCPCAYFFIA